MLSKFTKLAGRILAGTTLAITAGKVAANVFYAMGHRDGEINTLNVLSTLEDMCEGMSLEYVDYYREWKSGKVKNRIYTASVIYHEPFRIAALDWLRRLKAGRTLNINKPNTKIEDSREIKNIHQFLLRRRFRFASQNDEDVSELCLGKFDDIVLDADILQDLAIKYNVCYADKNDMIIFFGMDENIRLFAENFWTNYNLAAVSKKKDSGIPVGHYTLDNIEFEE